MNIFNIRQVSKSMNGYFWKTERPFESFKDDDIIYIPEYDFTEVQFFGDDYDFFDMQFIKDNKLGETYNDLKEACNNDLELMEVVFDMVDWQSFFDYNIRQL